MNKALLDRLIVVAGTTCCGKTRFINQLMSGDIENFSEKFQMGDLARWTYQDAYYLNKKRIAEIYDSSISKVLLHWTIPLPSYKLFIRNLLLFGEYDKKERLQLIKSSKHLIVLTLTANQDALFQRVDLRKKKHIEELRSKFFSFYKKNYKMRKIKKVERFYSKPYARFNVYQNWVLFVKTQLQPQVEFLIDVSEDPKIIEWKIFKDICCK